MATVSELTEIKSIENKKFPFEHHSTGIWKERIGNCPLDPSGGDPRQSWSKDKENRGKIA